MLVLCKCGRCLSSALLFLLRRLLGACSVGGHGVAWLLSKLNRIRSNRGAHLFPSDMVLPHEEPGVRALVVPRLELDLCPLDHQQHVARCLALAHHIVALLPQHVLETLQRPAPTKLSDIQVVGRAQIECLHAG